MIALSATLGASFAAMLLAAVVSFFSHLEKALTEVLAIGLVAVALVVFLDPLFERLRQAFGIEDGHHRGTARPRGRMLAWVGISLFMLNGILHTLLHEFIKEHPGLSTVLIAGWGPISTVVVTYAWLLGWHPDAARSRAALRGAVSGAACALVVVVAWVPYVRGVDKLILPALGLAVMTLVPFAGGLALDRGWGWTSRPSLSMTACMLAAWLVVGSLYWGWVFAFEDNLLRAFDSVSDVPIPGPILVNWADPKPGHRSFLLLSAPAAILGWGLGLLVSGRFDLLLATRRLEHTLEGA
jgi:hypothetical protein